MVAGRIEQLGDITFFLYGQSYLQRPDAVPLSLPELPLRRGRQRPLDGLRVAGCVGDAGPEACGSWSSWRATRGA